jgi:hypothetical protein
MQNGIQHAPRNRLAEAATVELASLLTWLQEIQLTQDEDDRRMLGGIQFSAKAAYLSLYDDHCDDNTTRL